MRLPRLPVTIGQVRELTQADTALLRERRATPKITKFRDAHHRVALLFALGHTTGEVMTVTGYSYERLRTLQSDPAFQDLVAKKREKAEQAHIDANAEYTTLSTWLRQAAARHLAQYFEELDEAGETVSPKTALAIAVEMADRTGFGRHTTSTNVNVGIGLELEERIRKFNALKQVEAVPSPQTSVQPKPAVLPPVTAPLPFKRRA